MIKKFKFAAALVFLLGFAVAVVPMKAQDLDHAEFGPFVDYTRLSQTHSNFGGVGGRLAVNAYRYIGFEAEMNYDFTQAFNETFTTGSSTTTTTTVTRTDFRMLHGLFGPKVQMGGPVKLFVTAKGGFVDFMFSPLPARFSTFTGSFDYIGGSSTHAVFYPGGGAEAFLGPVGLRLDVGDEIFWAGGAHHNLRVTFGPTFRF